MQMTNREIARNYKEAKHKKEQIRILADLNCCSVDAIKKILMDEGIPTQGVGGGIKPKAQNEGKAEKVECIANIPDALMDKKASEAITNQEFIPLCVFTAIQKQIENLEKEAEAIQLQIEMLQEQSNGCRMQAAELKAWMKGN